MIGLKKNSKYVCYPQIHSKGSLKRNPFSVEVVITLSSSLYSKFTGLSSKFEETTNNLPNGFVTQRNPSSAIVVSM